MKLTLRFDRPGCIDGAAIVTAKGFLLAALRWADERGPLPDWTALGFLPLDANGCGKFYFRGGRAAPPEATHVAAELISPDFARRERLLAPIPEPQRGAPMRFDCRIAAMSDLHLTHRPGRIRRALKFARGADCAVLAGDMTSDGAPEEFELVRALIEEQLPDVPVLAVAGNHDWPVNPLPQISEGVESYPALQSWLLERARGLGLPCEEDPCGAYRAQAGGLRILALNAATHWRRFAFPRGEQLDWLERELASGGRSLVLCHAPLLRHNPVRRGNRPPYLARDARLQGILDDARGAIFLSGHLHISLNEPSGCVELDEARGNLYVNDGSVTPPALKEAEPLVDREWLDGSVTLLNLGERGVELRARSLSSDKFIARGYYRWEGI